MNTPSVDSLIQALNEKGVCVFPGLFKQHEINKLCEEADRLWEQQTHRVPQNLRLGLRNDAQGKSVLDRIDPVEDLSEIFYQLNRHDRLMNIMASCFQENAMVMKEKLIFKFPGTEGFAVHRDDPYFSVSGVPGDKIISVAIALDPAKKENGNIEFFPQFTLETLKADQHEQRDIDAYAIASDKPFSPELQAGDAVIYNALVPHQSGSNIGKGSRRTYTISYAPATYDKCRENYYRARYQQQQQERQAANIDGPFFIS